MAAAPLAVTEAKALLPTSAMQQPKVMANRKCKWLSPF